MSSDPYPEWLTILTKPDIIEIVEPLISIFKERIRGSNDQPARFINIDNLEFEMSIIGGIAEISAIINLATDQGKHDQKLIIKQFRSYELLALELHRYKDLEQYAMRFPDISTYPLIYVDNDVNYLIFEVLQGFEIEQLDIPMDGKNYMLGKVFAAIHSDSVVKLDENIIREYLIFLLMHLPFTDEERESIVRLLEEQFIKISDCMGAYNATVNPTVTNFRFHPTGEQLNLATIKLGKAISVTIGPQETENLMNDRMFDVASVFSKRAYEEFLTTGGVVQTKLEMASFILGYDDTYSSLTTRKIKDLYPDGITLDLHFLTHVWLSEMEKGQSTEVDPNDFEGRDFLIYTLYLLIEKPFQNVFGIY